MDDKHDRLDSLRRVAARLRTLQEDDFARNMLARIEAEIARHDAEKNLRAHEVDVALPAMH